MSGFDEQFQVSPLAVHRHERRGGGSLTTRLIRLQSPTHVVVDPPTDELVVGLMLGGASSARWAWDGARPNMTAFRRPGTLGVTPVGATGTFEVEGSSTILIVVLPYRQLVERLEPEMTVPRDFGRLHDAYLDHPTARALCRRLWRAARTGGFERDGHLDALAESLLVTLAGAEPQTIEIGPGLTPREAACVVARAQGPGADVVSLAEAVAMPVRTFRRRFFASYGTSPHQWLADRRIGEARRLLAAPDRSLIDIALELGFSSQAHFTDAFRRAVGVSPGRWRRAIAS